jgi:hypothetical protein
MLLQRAFAVEIMTGLSCRGAMRLAKLANKPTTSHECSST